MRQLFIRPGRVEDIRFGTVVAEDGQRLVGFRLDAPEDDARVVVAFSVPELAAFAKLLRDAVELAGDGRS